MINLYDPGTLWDDVPLLGIDLESTGFSNKDRIVEIAMVLLRGYDVVDEFVTLVNPGIPIPRQVTAVHGLDDDDVAGAPTFEEVLPKVVQWLCRGAPWIAHNLAFDMRMLKNSMTPANWPRGVPTLCTMAMAKKKGHPKMKLLELAAYYKVEQRESHTAKDDAIVCARVARRLTRGLPLHDHYTKLSEGWL